MGESRRRPSVRIRRTSHSGRRSASVLAGVSLSPPPPLVPPFIPPPRCRSPPFGFTTGDERRRWPTLALRGGERPPCPCPCLWCAHTRSHARSRDDARHVAERCTRARVRRSELSRASLAMSLSWWPRNLLHLFPLSLPLLSSSPLLAPVYSLWHSPTQREQVVLVDTIARRNASPCSATHRHAEMRRGRGERPTPCPCRLDAVSAPRRPHACTRLLSRKLRVARARHIPRRRGHAHMGATSRFRQSRPTQTSDVKAYSCTTT